MSKGSEEKTTALPAVGAPEIIDWGKTQYAEALERQLLRVQNRMDDACGDCLIFTEHPPVYTIGSRRDAAQHVLLGPAELAAAGIELEKTNRGGDVTYHGPGQIVGYPVLSLRESRDLHAYLRRLEEVLIRSLAEFALQAERREGKTGIWLEDRKVAAMGVAVRQWICYHGFALNVNVNLDHFSGIVPCGIQSSEGKVTSMAAELGKQVDEAAVKAVIAIEFSREFTKS